MTSVEEYNPFQEGDSRRELWEPFFVEVREPLGPRIQHRACVDEDVVDTLHKYLQTPPDERSHRWEASMVPWLRTRKLGIEWPDTAPTDAEVVNLLLKATADDPMNAVPARLDRLADKALENFVKNKEDLGLYGQMLAHIGALLLTVAREERAVILARQFARGMLSPEQAAEERESDIQNMADLIRDRRQRWAAIALAQVTPQAPRATAEAGSHEEHRDIRKTDRQASIDYYWAQECPPPSAAGQPSAMVAGNGVPAATGESTPTLSAAKTVSRKLVAHRIRLLKSKKQYSENLDDVARRAHVTKSALYAAARGDVSHCGPDTAAEIPSRLGISEAEWNSE
jgi:hypothetical protein